MTKIVSICYDGGGWTFPYLAGITKYIQQHPNKSIEYKYAGISSGACVAAAAALDIPMDQLMNESLKWIYVCRFIPWSSVMAVKTMCNRIIGDRDVSYLDNKLAINVTKVGWFLKPTPLILSKFPNKNEMIKTITNSCAIPLVNSLAIKRKYYDGSFSVSNRFFKLPWKSDLVIHLSTYKNRKGATFNTTNDLKIWNSIFPLNTQKFIKLYEKGEEDGKTVLDYIVTELKL